MGTSRGEGRIELKRYGVQNRNLRIAFSLYEKIGVIVRGGSSRERGRRKGDKRGDISFRGRPTDSCSHIRLRRIGKGGRRHLL